MLAKTYAKKIKGGHGYRRVLICLHFILWLAVTAFGALYALRLINSFGIEAVDRVITKIKSLVAPVWDAVYSVITDLIPIPGALKITVAVALVLWALLLWAFLRLFRKRYITCISTQGTSLYYAKAWQRILPGTLTVTVDGEEIRPDVWFSDADMTVPAPAACRGGVKGLVFFARVEAPAVAEATVNETVAPTEETSAAEIVAPEEPVVETKEPEIQVIIREALEREAAKAEAPVEEAAPAAEPAPVAEPTPAVVEASPAVTDEDADDGDDEEEESEIREVTVNGQTFHMVIRYSRSFSARVIQAPDTLKNYYSEIKNELLSYNLVKSRISWKHDAFNRGRIQLAKLVVRGKNLCIYLALDPNAYEYEKYHQADKGDTNAYAKVPMMIRVKSDLGLRKAKFLIAEMMANYDIERGETQDLDFLSSYTYRDTKTLIREGLIKELETPSAE